MDNLVSIIVPVYNVERYVEKCLLSILSQSYKNIEIILIDDGSKDKSLTICQRYEKIDKRIRLVSQKNEGVASARNKGITEAKGTWIMFVDSDDWLEKDAIQVLLEKSEKNVDIIMGSYFYNFPDKEIDMTIIESFHEYHISQYIPEIYGACMINTNYFNNLFCKELRFGNIMHYPVLKLYRREVILNNDISFPNIKQNEDKIFNYLFIKNSRKILYVPKAIYHYRIRKGMASAASGEKLSNQYTQTIEKWKEIISKEENRRKDEILLFFDLNIYMMIKTVSDALLADIHGIISLYKSSLLLKHFFENTIIKESFKRRRFSFLPNISAQFSIRLFSLRLFSLELFISKLIKGIKNGKAKI